MNTGTENSNKENYQEKSKQFSPESSPMGNENYSSQEMNREHSDNIKAGEHNYQQDETQYGKIRQSETGQNATENRAEHLRDKVNTGMEHAGTKVNDWTDKTEHKMDEWSDKAKDKMNDMKDKVEDKMNWSDNTDRAERKFEKANDKMDKAEKKMDKAEDKFAKGYENDGTRKMEKAEKKMDKAEDKIQDAHEELGQNRSSYSSEPNSGKDNVEDYEKRTGMGSPYSNNPSTGNTGKI